MRAVRFAEYGDVDVLDVVEVPAPQPGDGEVVVAVRAAGINPGEARIREGALHEQWPATFPEGEGSDFAGVVTAVGAGVTHLAVGDEVLGFTDDRSSHAEFVVTDAGQVIAKSARLPWEVAGALFVVGTSAYALVEAAHIGPDDIVVVSGAAGGTGSFTAQWARRAGATVIGLAGPDSHAWLRQRGIVPVDYRGADLAARVRSAAGGQVTALLDTYGAPYGELGVALGVAPARIASIADFTVGRLGGTVVLHSTVADAGTLTRLAAAVEAGEVEVPIAATYPLDQVRAAFTELANGHTHGKIVLVP